MFDLGATIHDHGESGRARKFGGFFAHDAELHPDDLDSKSFFLRQHVSDDFGRGIGCAENLDHVDRWQERSLSDA